MGGGGPARGRRLMGAFGTHAGRQRDPCGSVCLLTPIPGERQSEKFHLLPPFHPPASVATVWSPPPAQVTSFLPDSSWKYIQCQIERSSGKWNGIKGGLCNRRPWQSDHKLCAKRASQTFTECPPNCLRRLSAVPIPPPPPPPSTSLAAANKKQHLPTWLRCSMAPCLMYCVRWSVPTETRFVARQNQSSSDLMKCRSPPLASQAQY